MHPPELAGFPTSAPSIVTDEQGATAWFASRFSPTSFGVFDVLPDDDARNTHLAGGVGPALGPNTDVLFSEPQMETIDVLADKFPLSAVDSDVWV